MTSIFLFYARNDDEAFVRRLHADLTHAGLDMWFDRVSMPLRQFNSKNSCSRKGIFTSSAFESTSCMAIILLPMNMKCNSLQPGNGTPQYRCQENYRKAPMEMSLHGRQIAILCAAFTWERSAKY
jgi:hypothetical protein